MLQYYRRPDAQSGVLIGLAVASSQLMQREYIAEKCNFLVTLAALFPALCGHFATAITTYMKFTVKQIATLLGGEVAGDDALAITGLAKIEEGKRAIFRSCRTSSMNRIYIRRRHQR